MSENMPARNEKIENLINDNEGEKQVPRNLGIHQVDWSLHISSVFHGHSVWDVLLSDVLQCPAPCITMQNH